MQRTSVNGNQDAFDMSSNRTQEVVWDAYKTWLNLSNNSSYFFCRIQKKIFWRTIFAHTMRVHAWGLKQHWLTLYVHKHQRHLLLCFTEELKSTRIIMKVNKWWKNWIFWWTILLGQYNPSVCLFLSLVFICFRLNVASDSWGTQG